MSLIIIPKFLNGTDILKKITTKAFNSDYIEIYFDEIKVPAENLLGQENQALNYIFHQCSIGSLSESAASVSIAELNLKAIIEYVNNQQYRGKKVSQLQSIRHNIAQMLTEFECTKQFLYTLYSRFLKEEDLYKEIIMLKHLSSELDNKIKSNCVKIFNEYGFSKKYSSIEFFNNNGNIISFKNESNSLLDTISNFILENELPIAKSKHKKIKTLVR